MVGYAIILAGALFFTNRRSQEFIEIPGFRRLLISFFCTLVAMVFAAALVCILLSLALAAFVFMRSQEAEGSGGFLVFLILGPPICFSIGSVCSLALAPRISRFFWKKEPPGEDAAEGGRADAYQTPSNFSR
jgi:hypothetical protein